MTQRSQYMLGYNDTRCDDPRGQYYNGLTKRAMVVRADGTDRREVGRSLITREYQVVGFAGWWPDGRAIIGLSYKSAEVGAWETRNKTFAHERTEGIELDSCLVDIDTGEAVNLTAVERVSNYNAGLAPWPGDPRRATFAPIINGLQQPYVMDANGRNKQSLASGKEAFTYGLNVSPDGRRIAYHKNYQIYVADKDGSNPRAIDPDPSHTFQFCPTWSPDGRWLLFLTPEHYKCHPHIVAADGTGLRKLADRGGYRSVMEMLDYPDFHSGSSDLPVWSPDSKWVYYTAQVGEAVELMRVSLDGQVQQLTHSPAGVFCYHPKVSPDGRLVVFGSTRDGARALYVADADGGDVQAITVPVRGRAQIHAYWRPILTDPAQKAPAASQETASMAATQAAATSQPQAGVIVFSYITYPRGTFNKGDTSQGSIYSVRSDGTGLTEIIDLGCANNPKVSPDGQWLYFQSNKTGNWHIYRCHLDGSGLEDLTANENLGKDSFGFDLSPDGRKIVFTSAHDRVSRVTTMNADGTDQRLLASELGFCYMASFSPDGKQIVFAHTAEGYTLKLADLDGSNMISLTPDLKECFAPQFTPEGQWIYFIRRDGDIYRVSPDATRLERLTQGNGYVELHMNAEDEHGSTDAPRISPDGRRIAFCGMENGLSQVRVMNIDGTGLRQLTNLPDRCGRVRWSPDSRQISFISFVRDSQPQLFVIDADGGEPRQITDLPGAAYLMEWAPR
jgi:Tol biopolymer transport system component